MSRRQAKANVKVSHSKPPKKFKGRYSQQEDGGSRDLGNSDDFCHDEIDFHNDQKKHENEDKQSRKLFVGGLRYCSTKETLYSHFKQWGRIVDCCVISDPHTKESRGFGFVTYKQAHMVENAEAARLHIIDGQKVELRRAASRKAVAVPAVLLKKKKKRAKKEKKRQEQEALGNSSTAELPNSLEPVAAENGLAEDFDSTISPKKKSGLAEDFDSTISSKKKRKRKQMVEEGDATNMDGILNNDVSEVAGPKKKKKKKKKKIKVEVLNETVALETAVFASESEVDASPKKKKKKKKMAVDDSLQTSELGTFEYSELNVPESGKKKKKKKVKVEVDD